MISGKKANIVIIDDPWADGEPSEADIKAARKRIRAALLAGASAPPPKGFRVPIRKR